MCYFLQNYDLVLKTCTGKPGSYTFQRLI